MNYIEYIFKIEPLQPGTEILIAELGYAGFESFVETEEGVTAYIQKEVWNGAILDEMARAPYIFRPLQWGRSSFPTRHSS